MQNLVVVSLYKDPADKIPYEEIFGHFADAVYEATEGGHKIGKVFIYTGGEYNDKADIVWKEKGYIIAFNSGYGRTGLDISMYDTLEGSVSFIEYDRIGAGYTLAHEWGHYAYGFGEEYKVQNGDIGVAPSIMNSHWRATGGDYRWLNLSIPWSPTGGDYRDTNKTDQHRRYQASCWETLARNPVNDPKPAGSTAESKRPYWPELAAFMPRVNP